METTIVYWGHIGRIERNMETTTVYWGYIIGIMEKKTEITVVYKGGKQAKIQKRSQKSTATCYRTYSGILGL